MQAAEPPSDRHQLQQIVAGLTEGVMLVDDRQVIIWANPAALAMHGVSSLSALGPSVDDYRRRFRLRYRNNHVLQKGDYPIERIIAGDAFRDVVVEVTPPGAHEPRWVHRVRSLVLTHPTGEPDCLVLILADITEQAEAEQRFESAFNANPAPAVIVRLRDRIFLRLNRGFTELSGFTARLLVGQSLDAVDLFADARHAGQARLLFARGQSIPHRETCLHGPAGRRAVIMAGQPIEIDDQPCMLFTFSDLEPTHHAEEALQATREQSRADFEALYTETPVPLHSLDQNGRIVSVSTRWLELMEYERHEVLGRPLTDFLTPESAGMFVSQNWPRLLADGAVHDLEYRFRKKSGTIADVLLSARSGFDQHGAFVRTMAILTDVTEKRHGEERFAKAFNLAPVPMLLCNLAGFEVVDVNKAFQDLTGQGDYAAIWPDAGQRADFERLLGSGAVRNHTACIAIRDGGTAECLLAAETVSLLGKPCALIVLQDVTERRRSEAELFQAIESVMHDTSWFSQSIIEKLANLRQVPGIAAGTSLKELTRREQEILGQISCGQKDDAIGAGLGLSRNTIRNHTASIYAKIGVNSRSAAIVWARERGITGQPIR